MNAWIILSDSACSHPDGTFSALRAGLDRVTAPELPVRFNGAVVARVVPDRPFGDRLRFRIFCRPVGGSKEVMAVEGDVDILKVSKGQVLEILNLVGDIQVSFEKEGNYEVVLAIDDREVATYRLLVALRGAQE